ncbi:multicomponent Na+:H+ antiporter subunit G [Natronocella acetinitrilica]|uniref:Multicomponent Na+:H+ antiporter subunit G n=1 Tax=Natronocella acetinitrilica TaxID=414046 RepID=A0AAE3G3V1_9GAMM|nr:multicomponent Na+:H+ antiporter subunit G [Natronocella acetinitrilica]
MLEAIAALLIVAGLLFYLAGTVGLLRFPDLYTRLHALTKADNTGLGLLSVGVALLWGSWRLACLIALVWLVAVVAASIACHLVAGHRLTEDEARQERS